VREKSSGDFQKSLPFYFFCVIFACMGENFSDIVEKGRSILAKRDGENFFTRKVENSDGSGVEKYSLSDAANFLRSMAELEKLNEAVKLRSDIYKPVLMVNAL